MKPAISDTGASSDPAVRVSYEGRQFHISVDLPGATEEQIRIDLEKTVVTLSVSREGEVIRKIIRIPEGLRFFRKKLSDGVLDIFLEKPVP